MPKIRKNTYAIDNIHNKLYLDQCGSVAVFDEGSHLVEDKIMPIHGVLIILIVSLNMSCINFLTTTHNLSMIGNSRFTHMLV